jgi:hypothetical protein
MFANFISLAHLDVVPDELAEGCRISSRSGKREDGRERKNPAWDTGAAESLSPREREIMIQVAHGRLSKQIAGDIGIKYSSFVNTPRQPEIRIRLLATLFVCIEICPHTGVVRWPEGGINRAGLIEADTARNRSNRARNPDEIDASVHARPVRMRNFAASTCKRPLKRALFAAISMRR